MCNQQQKRPLLSCIDAVVVIQPLILLSTIKIKITITTPLLKKEKK